MQKDQGMLPTPIASLSLGTICFISTPTISFEILLPWKAYPLYEVVGEVYWSE